MAAGAILGESRRPVVGIVGPIEVREMTPHAGRGGGIEVVVGVALRTIQRGVGPGEGKSGELSVIELGPQPAVHGVTLLAVGGEVQRGMAGVVSLLKVRRVARDAGS